MEINNLSRRHFLRNASIGGTGIILAPTLLKSCAPGAAPSDRINIAHIGVGSQGQGELKSYFVPLETSYQVATCDPFKQRREASAFYISQQYKERGVKAPEVKSYLYFEEILERDDIDAVHITTPDHWHVPLAIHAARAGKHIMLAKPLGLSYPNFKILEKELAANNVRFHYGTQQRAQQHMQEGIKMIKEGVIGEIEKVHVWCAGKNKVQSPVCHEVPVPDDFDFDLWTGPAPLNTYCPDRVTNNSSWFQYDYSIGFLGGWGAHPLDVMVWGIKDKLSGKYSCEGSGNFWNEGGMYNNIMSWDLKLEYESGIKVDFVSTDRLAEKDFLHYRQKKDGNGTTFFGSKGWISLSRNSVESNIPEVQQKLSELSQDPNGFGQMFVDVIKGDIAETNPVDEAILSDCISHMGDIAIRTGEKITWDPNAGKVIDNDAANDWFLREMRKPYTV
ncbi:Gfo/Idh/MocA family oxidoreductase [Prolixibacteraceae bacterium Z1-6]|uniref:Gfo/Idh/MocA family oxidoreductase n=1 Tax=Draconibacterium aestuarii TaxID=2998507 RepID=A0A9X3F4Z3_9BACT|nr:Gfo/Idh/MocA family oxidoreductase [Prolixibacteraceae bacterium Z1-6]